MEQGRLIVSTRKNLTGRIAVVCVCGAFLVAMGIFIMVNAEAFRALNRDFGVLLGYVGGAMLVVLPFFSLAILVQKQNSYLAVYEHCVEGAAISNEPASVMGAAITGKTPRLEKFTLRYDEILNVGAPEGKISLYTGYATYQVLAMANQKAALAELRKRIPAQKEAAV